MNIRPFAHVIGLVLLVGISIAAERPESSLEARVEEGIRLINQQNQAGGKATLEKAAEEAKALVVATPADAKANRLLARALFYLEKDAEALAAIDQAVKLAPGDAVHHFDRGQMLAATGKQSAAIESLTRATELAPANVEYWLALGYRFADLATHDEAERVFTRAVEANPSEPRLLGALAGVLATAGKPERAMPLLEKAVKLDPKYQNGWRNIGQLHQSAGRPAESNKAYAALLDLSPEDSAAWAKRVQNCTALSDAPGRDAARAKLMALYKAGKTTQPFFCREQFKVADMPVMAFEYYELTGERALRYSFRILDDAGRPTQRTVSLGSYEMTTMLAREKGTIGESDRMFHLDLYEPGSHSTFGLFKTEPAYDQVRESVVAILTNKMEAMSKTKVGEMKD